MNFRRYRQPELGEFFCVFVDTAGEGSDWNAAMFLSKTRLDVPIVYHYSGTITNATPELKTELEHLYDTTHVKPVVAYETNNGGGYELDRLARLNYNQKYRLYTQKRINSEGKLEDTGKLGWNTNTATRSPMLEALKDAIQQRVITIYDKPTVNQMYSFVKKQGSSGTWKAAAEVGAHDDLIMALAGAYQLYQTEQPDSTQNAMLYARDPNMELLWNEI